MKNRDEFSVQVLGHHMRLSRHDGKPVVLGWDDLQALKNEAFGPGESAVEVFPAEENVVNEANIRHFWILPEKELDTWGIRLHKRKDTP